MAKLNPSTITLKGDPQGREGLATASITPGMLLAVSGPSVAPHGEAGGANTAAFAREMDIVGGTIDDVYENGDTVLYSEFRKGDMVYALLAAGSDVAAGDLLQSDGAGALEPVAAGSQDTETPFAYTAGGSVIARASEAVDNDPGTGGAAVRIRVEVL